MKKELQRQIFHLVLGIGTILFLFIFGRGFMIAAVFSIIVVGTLLINARLLKMKIPLIEWFEKHFEREDVIFPGWGSACYAAGVLILLTFLADINQIITSVFLLGIGDGFSSIIGSMGKMRVPYNRDKTIEGMIAFFLTSLPAYVFIGPSILPLALIGAAVESIDFKVDDNLMIPIACAIFFLVI